MLDKLRVLKVCQALPSVILGYRFTSIVIGIPILNYFQACRTGC